MRLYAEKTSVPVERARTVASTDCGALSRPAGQLLLSGPTSGQVLEGNEPILLVTPDPDDET